MTLTWETHSLLLPAAAACHCCRRCPLALLLLGVCLATQPLQLGEAWKAHLTANPATTTQTAQNTAQQLLLPIALSMSYGGIQPNAALCKWHPMYLRQHCSPGPGLCVTHQRGILRRHCSSDVIE